MPFRCSTVPGPYGVEPCFHECFSSAASMIGRGWTLYNAPTFTGNGMTLNGTTQYATIPTSRVTASFLSQPTTEITFVCTFTPTFAAAEAVNRSFYDAVAPNRYLAFRESSAPNYPIGFYAGATTLVGSVAIATYGPLWLQNQRNQLVSALKSGANVFYLNGTQIGTSVTAWSKVLVSSLVSIGAFTSPVGNYFAGTMHDFGIYGRQITPAEVTSLWQNGSL